MNVTATSTADQQLHDAPGNNAAADASIHSTGGSFGRVVRAELQRALRPASLLIVAAGASLFAIVAGVSVWLAADDSGPSAGSRAGGARLADLAGTGGATEAFAVGASFGGFLAFVTFIALMAGEFSGGTFRAMLLRYPHRMRLIVGKLVGLLLVASAAIALAELATVAVSWLVAPTQDVATDQWFSMASLGEAVTDYLTVVGGIAGWAVFGTTLAVIFRSVPLALGVGFAWAGPFENIVVDSWSPGFRFFPGQVLGSLMRGGTAELGLGRATITALLYTGVAFAATLLLTSRRDVTS